MRSECFGVGHMGCRAGRTSVDPTSSRELAVLVITLKVGKEKEVWILIILLVWGGSGGLQSDGHGVVLVVMMHMLGGITPRLGSMRLRSVKLRLIMVMEKVESER